MSTWQQVADAVRETEQGKVQTFSLRRVGGRLGGRAGGRGAGAYLLRGRVVVLSRQRAARSCFGARWLHAADWWPAAPPPPPSVPSPWALPPAPSPLHPHPLHPPWQVETDNLSFFVYSSWDSYDSYKDHLESDQHK